MSLLACQPLWIMWISYPQILWISDFHRLFRNGMWITLSENWLDFSLKFAKNNYSSIICKNDFISFILLKCLGGVDHSYSLKHFSIRKKRSYPQKLWITP